jgi:hypothetical protein
MICNLALKSSLHSLRKDDNYTKKSYLFDHRIRIRIDLVEYIPKYKDTYLYLIIQFLAYLYGYRSYLF